MKTKCIWHNAKDEMPHAENAISILFFTKTGEWLVGYCYKDMLETTDAFFEQSEIEKWCFLEDILSLAD